MRSDQPSIRKLVEDSVSKAAKHLRAIYAFVLRFRTNLARETIRARVYEAVADGHLRRIAEGVYLAKRGPASLLLVEGDARDVLKKWESNSIDLILTDPPYDLGTRKHALTGTTRPHRGRGRSYEQWDLDAETLQEMFRVLRKDREWNTLNERRRESGDYPRGGGALLLFSPPIARSTWPHIRSLIELAERLGFVFYGTITWDQVDKGMGYDCGRNQKNEILFFTAANRNGLLWDLGLSNVIRFQRIRRRAGEHEAQKPTALFLRIIAALTKPGDVLADFFVGRGRWVLATVESGRHVIAVERDGEWIKRIRNDFVHESLDVR